MTDKPAVRLCDTCDHSYQAIHFLDEKRPHTCKWCCAKTNELQAKEEAAGKARKTFAEILDKANVRRADLPQIEEMCGGIVEAYGGMNLFCTDVADYLKDMIARRPTSGAAAQIMLRFIDLVGKANEHVRRVHVDEMNQEQIRQEQQRMLMELLVQASADPDKQQFLINLLQQKGNVDTVMQEALQIHGETKA